MIHQNDEDDLSGSKEPQPFIGKYHSVLRRRKNEAEAVIPQPKKEYKKKKISYKSLVNLYHCWRVEQPLTEKHVFNFQNILAINEYSLRNPQSDESFLSTKFYMKKVKKVILSKGVLLFNLEDVEMLATPIPYICERLKSYGDSKFYDIATTLEHLEDTLSQIHRRLPQQKDYNDGELQCFLSEMKDRMFFSQYAPNLLIISQKLLEMLGYDVEQFAIESIKHKSILYEFFSAEHYTGVISKHLDNIELLRDFLTGIMSLDDFCQRSLMIYNDFVYNRLDKKIRCQFFAGMSKHLTPYIEIKQMGKDQEEARALSHKQILREQRVKEFKQTHLRKQIELLKVISCIPKQIDPSYEQRICSYRNLQYVSEQGQTQK